jgi:RimJ/RimL family protein N-acetyltransferase
MTDTIILKNTSLEDVEPFLKAVRRVAKEGRFSPATEGYSLEDTRDFIQYNIDHSYPQHLAFEDDEIVAWCHIIPKQVVGMNHVGTLGLGMLADYRGNGIGSELIKNTIEHAKRINHIERVELEVNESNRYAIELFKRMGFNIEGKRPKARKTDGVYDNIILMGKNLK